MVHLDYRDARPIYTQIVDGFREQIRSGILQIGDKLPSVRELATTLTINPNTIQRAYRELEMEGWIGSMAGKGSFVCGKAAASSSQWDALDSAAGQLLAQGVTLEEIIKHLEQGGDHNA